MVIQVHQFVNPAFLDLFYNYGLWCWEGMSVDDENIKTITENLQLTEENEIYWCYGQVLNKYYNLDDPYPADLPIVFISNYYDAQALHACNAVWFNELVDSFKEG